MGGEEQLIDDDENWLHEEWITCPACGQSLFRIDQSPFDNSSHLYCDRCPIRVEVLPYEPEYEQIEQSLRPYQADQRQYYAALKREIEAHLKPCACGGTFRFDAPRRCFSCYAPVIVDGPAGVDLYLNDDGFSDDSERLKRYEAWRAQFVPTLEDIWQYPC